MTLGITVNGESVQGIIKAKAYKGLPCAFGYTWFTVAGNTPPFAIGDTASVALDGNQIINGTIDQFQPIFKARAFYYNYLIRDFTALACVDTQIQETTTFQSPITLSTILTQLTGLPVRDELGIGRLEANVYPEASAGEGVWDFCEKLVRIKNGLLTSDDDGNLLITREGKSGTNANRLTAGVNVIEAVSNEYSKYKYDTWLVYSQTNSVKTEALNVNVLGSVGNGTRAKVFIENNALSGTEVSQRATFQQDMAKQEELCLEVRHSGYSIEGAFLRRNETLEVEIPQIGIQEVLFIDTMCYERSNDGEIAIITLRRFTS